MICCQWLNPFLHSVYICWTVLIRALYWWRYADSKLTYREWMVFLCVDSRHKQHTTYDVGKHVHDTLSNNGHNFMNNGRTTTLELSLSSMFYYLFIVLWTIPIRPFLEKLYHIKYHSQFDTRAAGRCQPCSNIRIISIHTQFWRTRPLQIDCSIWRVGCCLLGSEFWVKNSNMWYSSSSSSSEKGRLTSSEELEVCQVTSAFVVITKRDMLWFLSTQFVIPLPSSMSRVRRASPPVWYSTTSPAHTPLGRWPCPVSVRVVQTYYY